MNQVLSYSRAQARSKSRAGAAAARRGALEEAVARYEDAILAAKDYMPAHLNLASLLLHSGRAADAIAACERAFELDESARHPYLWLVRGMAHAALGHAAEAEADLVLYQERAPDPRFTRVVWRALRDLDRSGAETRPALLAA